MYTYTRNLIMIMIKLNLLIYKKIFRVSYIPDCSVFEVIYENSCAMFKECAL